jgi:hypothetical protein
VIDAEKFLVGGLSWQMTLLILTIWISHVGGSYERSK